MNAELTLSERVFGPSTATSQETDLQGQEKNPDEAVPLTVEQAALRRVLRHYRPARSDAESARAGQTMGAVQALRERMQAGTLSPEGLQALVQLALRCEEMEETARLAANYLQQNPGGLGSEPLIELVVDALAKAQDWDWMQMAWRADVDEESVRKGSGDGVEQDTRVLIKVRPRSSRMRAWLGLLFDSEQSTLRDRLIERGVFKRAAQRPNALSSLLTVFLDEPKDSLGRPELPLLSAFLSALSAFGFDQGPPPENLGVPALVRVIDALGQSDSTAGWGCWSAKRQAQESQSWLAVLVDAPNRPWLLHNHTHEGPQAFIGDVLRAQPHPLWCLASGMRGRGIWPKLLKRITPLLETLVSLGYGVNGEIPQTWAGRGAPTKAIDWSWPGEDTPEGEIVRHLLKNRYPCSREPTALWALVGADTLYDAALPAAMRALLGLGGDVQRRGGAVQPNGSRQSLLAYLNEKILENDGDLKVVEEVFAVLVTGGLDPVSTLRAPSVEQVQAGRMREWVRAAMEQQEMANDLAMHGLSAQDLREAVALLREKRSREKAQQGQVAPQQVAPQPDGLLHHVSPQEAAQTLAPRGADPTQALFEHAMPTKTLGREDCFEPANVNGRAFESSGRKKSTRL